MAITRDTHNSDREKSSGQAHLLNFCTTGAMDRTSGQAEFVAQYFFEIPASACAGVFKQSMGARNRVGLGWSYRPARLQASVVDSLESNLGFLKSIKILNSMVNCETAGFD